MIKSGNMANIKSTAIPGSVIIFLLFFKAAPPRTNLRKGSLY